MWVRLTAGVLLGLPLAVAVIGILDWVWPGPWQAVLVPMLVLFFPLWTVLMAAAFAVRSGRRAWTWMGLGNVLAFGVLWTLKHGIGVH